MRKTWLIAAAAALVAVGAVAATAAGGSDSRAPMAHAHGSAATKAAAGADLRVTLDRLLGEHFMLATAATQRGLQGGKEFPALAKALARNSVELSKAVCSVFGKKRRPRRRPRARRKQAIELGEHERRQE